MHPVDGWRNCLFVYKLSCYSFDNAWIRGIEPVGHLKQKMASCSSSPIHLFLVFVLRLAALLLVPSWMCQVHWSWMHLCSECKNLLNGTIGIAVPSSFISKTIFWRFSCKRSVSFLLHKQLEYMYWWLINHLSTIF